MTYGTQPPEKKDSVAAIASPFPFFIAIVFDITGWVFSHIGDFNGTKTSFTVTFIALALTILLSFVGLVTPGRKKKLALGMFFLSITGLIAVIVTTPALYDHDLLAIFGLSY